MIGPICKFVRLGATAAVCFGLIVHAAADDRVTITGGADGTGQNYEWTVQNNDPSARIVEVDFPHFHADIFIVPDPDLWQQECTGMANAGSTTAQEGGVCRAWVEDPRRGIARGFSAVFRMRVSRAGAQRRYGNVTVKFADGTRTVVSGVELPTEQTFGERYIMAIGLGVILLVLVLMRTRSKRAATAPDHPAVPPDDGQ